MRTCIRQCSMNKRTFVPFLPSATYAWSNKLTGLNFPPNSASGRLRRCQIELIPQLLRLYRGLLVY